MNEYLTRFPHEWDRELIAGLFRDAVRRLGRPTPGAVIDYVEGNLRRRCRSCVNSEATAQNTANLLRTLQSAPRETDAFARQCIAAKPPRTPQKARAGR